MAGRWRESLTAKAHNVAQRQPTKGNNETEQEAGREAENDCLRVESGLPLAWAEPSFACALAQKAHRDGYSSLYTRAAALFCDLAIARVGASAPLPAKLSRIDLIVIDEWAMGAVKVKRMGAS